MTRICSIPVVLVIFLAFLGVSDAAKILGNDDNGNKPETVTDQQKTDQPKPPEKPKAAKDEATPEREFGTKMVENAAQLAKDKKIIEKVQKPIAPIYVPTDLTGMSDKEIEGYVNILMMQRRKIQKRITKHIVVTAILNILYYFLHTYFVFEKSLSSLFSLNNRWRETINAEWMVHQEQLADFLYEYIRVKDVKYESLVTRKYFNVPFIRMKYGDDRFVNFPVWRKNKPQKLSVDAEIRQPWPMLKNWMTK